MEIHHPGIYHIYNRGNNKQRIFYNEGNYLYFLEKCHRYLKPVGEIFAWCLMPNHFHFLVEVNEKSLLPVKSGGITMPSITNGFRLLQSSYTKGINVQQRRTGNLFQQKTKAKLVNGKEDYSTTVFFYIHQNPVKAKLVKRAADWQYCSFRDYMVPATGTLSNTERCMVILDLSALDLESEVVKPIDGEIIKSFC